MKWYQKPVYALLVFLAVALASSIVQGGRQLASKTAVLEDQFYNGTHHDGLSVHYDLDKLQSVSTNLVALCEKNGLTYDSVSELKELSAEYPNLTLISEYSEWFHQVKGVLDIALADVKEAELPNKYAEMVVSYEAVYKSAYRTIAYDDFNGMVREYEIETSGLLAQMMMKITSVKEVGRFE